MRVVVAGGGVAGLEGLLALRALAGDQVDLTVVAPDPAFTYRPLAVAEPFAMGHAYRVPLKQFADDTGAELVIDATVGVDDTARELRLRDGGARSFDALLVSPGARAVEGLEGAVTWWPGGDPEVYSGLLRDMDEGYSKRIAIVVPPGAVWPLPAYELALMTAGEARDMGHEDVSVTVVTPERRALSLFGDEASEAVAEELRKAGVELKAGAVARRDGAALVLEPSGERLDVQRVFAVPRLLGPALDGLPADEEGFIVAGDDARVQGCERTWAAGDAVVSPLKFGGLATHQARRAAAEIARAAGVKDVPDPGEPVIHGRLLIGRGSRRLRGRGDARGRAAVVAAGQDRRRVPPALADRARRVAPGGRGARRGHRGAPAGRELPSHELEYLHGLAREFRSADPAIASLGRHMREARDR